MMAGMADSLFDGKSFYGYPLWNTINRFVINTHFNAANILGMEHLPAGEPFILISNHTSRFDGLVVQYLLNRRANYMVSPNEMKGLQRAAVMSVGAFPANPRLDLVGYSTKQLLSGEPVVVFPEGNVFYDGETHRFKTGTAKIALEALENGMDLSVVPLGIQYLKGPRFVASIGEPLRVGDLVEPGEKRESIKRLTDAFHGSVLEMVNLAKSVGANPSGGLIATPV